MSTIRDFHIGPRNDYILLQPTELPDASEGGGLIITRGLTVDEGVARVIAVGPGNMHFIDNSQELAEHANRIAQELIESCDGDEKKAQEALEKMDRSTLCGWPVGCKGINPGDLVTFLYHPQNPEIQLLEDSKKPDGLMLVREEHITANLSARKIVLPEGQSAEDAAKELEA